MKSSNTAVGVDTAKRVFQLCWVEMETGEIEELRLTRARFLEHFANRAPCVVAMEACGRAQHWSRRPSRRGDRYLRTLLIHGARTALSNGKAPPEWALRLAARRPANVATVALANKMARIIWALLAHERDYRPDYGARPA